MPTSVLGRSFSRYSTSACLRYQATAKMSPTHSMGRMMPVEALPPNESAMRGMKSRAKPFSPALDMPMTTPAAMASTHWNSSTLRSHREKLSGGGKPSGPLSFMRVYDQIAAVVKSGGKTRRAAKMQSLKVWHPDIMEFIECKSKEEKKARLLIEKGGYDANFNGEAYSSILFQNANLSVRVTDEFMQAVDRE